jgi:hypothetical protein
MSWREQAKCKGQPLHKFYPDRTERRASVRDAIDLCEQCPVLKMCATDALLTAQKSGVCGVWAGVYLGDTPVWRGAKLAPLKAIAGPITSRHRISHRHNRHSDDYTPSGKAIAHLGQLWDMGMTNPGIARAANISLHTLNALIYDGAPEDQVELSGRSIRPRDLMTRTIEAALLSVPVPSERVSRKQTQKLNPNPGRCIACSEAIGSRRDPNWRGVRYGGKGRCERCYQAHRRQQVETAVS